MKAPFRMAASCFTTPSLHGRRRQSPFESSNQAAVASEDRRPIVLAVDDDPGDRVLLQQAFDSVSGVVDLRIAVDGEELLDYLYQRPPWDGCERPDLILLDLNMPRVHGLDLLRAIKENEELKPIPVVMLTTSKEHEDVVGAYANGANTYVPKPASFDKLEGTIQALCEFWFGLCVLPGLDAQ